MHNPPLISVIMPVHNAQKYLAESIESILAQTYTNFELIIVNDRSVDDTTRIVQSFAAGDSRIVLIDNKHAAGIAGALNTGLSLAKGTYIARADGDDLNMPSRFQKQIEYLETHPDISIVGAQYQTFSDSKIGQVHKHPSHPYKIAWKFITNTYFCHPTVMFRASILDTVPYYPEVASEDFAFFSESIHTYQGSNISKVLLKYRQHETNYSNTDRSKINPSVEETYKKNFIFYTGSLEHAELFYAFHAKHDLSLRKSILILSTSLTVARKIHAHYKRSIWSYIYLLSVIKIHILKSILWHYLKPVYRAIKPSH